MADGYSRVTGRHGVCIAQNGPGITNFVTGVAAAYWAHSPVVAITPETGTAGMEMCIRDRCSRAAACARLSGGGPVRGSACGRACGWTWGGICPGPREGDCADGAEPWN